jgi:uncharacterized cupin superfamily protein
MTNEAFGAACIFEGVDVSFPRAGFTLVVFHPGQVGMYHREANQEDFLVLAGEYLLLIEGESNRSGRGTSSTARRTPSTASWGRGTARAWSS